MTGVGKIRRKVMAAIQQEEQLKEVISALKDADATTYKFCRQCERTRVFRLRNDHSVWWRCTACGYGIEA